MRTPHFAGPCAELSNIQTMKGQNGIFNISASCSSPSPSAPLHVDDVPGVPGVLPGGGPGTPPSTGGPAPGAVSTGTLWPPGQGES